MPILETRSEVQVKVTETQGWYVKLCHPEMHPPTKFGFPTSNNIRDARHTFILRTRSEVKVTVTCKWYQTLHLPKMHPQTKFWVPISNNLRDMLRTQFLFQYAFVNQIWNSYLNEYRRYAPDAMTILETMPEVEVTLSKGWYATLRHPKMHPYTKFGIPTSNNMRFAVDTIILKTRLEVKITVTRKWYSTLCHPKTHPHTKFGIPALKNIGDMHRTRSRTDGLKDGRSYMLLTVLEKVAKKA